MLRISSGSRNSDFEFCSFLTHKYRRPKKRRCPKFCRFPKKAIHHRDTEITEDKMKKGKDSKKPADSTHSGFSFPFLHAG
ncbi:MAG: hypothetical protein D6679_11675 [Candidatus Hydrogenedentota bacterium]|nr:MAG: hypothetical protein D6679_11675 [Candidatus Hydrogenedentota bacterium]